MDSSNINKTNTKCVDQNALVFFPIETKLLGLATREERDLVSLIRTYNRINKKKQGKLGAKERCARIHRASDIVTAQNPALIVERNEDSQFGFGTDETKGMAS